MYVFITKLKSVIQYSGVVFNIAKSHIAKSHILLQINSTDTVLNLINMVDFLPQERVYPETGSTLLAWSCSLTSPFVGTKI